MNAKWVLTTVDSGIEVVYHNLVDAKTMNCGVAPTQFGLPECLEFVLMEGGMSGDVVVFDGKQVCEIIINEKVDNGPTQNQRN
jgi:hypothetical protein